MSLHLLIVSASHNPEYIPSNEIGASIITAFKKAGFTWDLYIPWLPFNFELSDYDAVFCWFFGASRFNIHYWSKQFEKECRAKGKQVINGITNSYRTHSYCYDRWKSSDIFCPNYQHFNHFEDIILDYPIILRTDDQHEAANVKLVHSPQEAQRAIDAQKKAYLQSDPENLTIRPFDLAIRYLDIKSEDGFYHKRRSIIVGDTIIPRDHTISTNWIVNLSNQVENEYAIALNQQFFTTGETQATSILKAAQALGGDILALDYTVTDEGQYIFWEGNRYFKMKSNTPFKENDVNPATGLNYLEMKALDEKVGEEVVRLIHKKIGEQ